MESQLVKATYLNNRNVSTLQMSYVDTFRLYAKCIFGCKPSDINFDNSMNFECFKLFNNIELTDEKRNAI